ncbi:MULTISPECIES: TomO hydrophobic C-terminal domain-containing protein [Wolbachia]|uniref:Uncharacterized protein n=1 Tax=Wolbachia pipientis TaxID=955 RepID=A0A7G5CC16_WOLPI|nr:MULTISPECIES: hypothetical protein [Wolbachia]MDE5061393.1 hypothetical protein [Wolbachia endosymbiont of Drosophila nikananu]QMV46750.1 hypothetical protein HC356_01115 [Wolbachia pipientis]
MEFADLISHKNGFNAMVVEDPLIMSHIECNINGRDEVPLYINNNRNSMELRQLCGTENMSVRFPSSIGADLVAGGSLAMRSTCSNSELSQQPQKNIVDKRENVMNNENDPIGGVMGKKGKQKNKENGAQINGKQPSDLSNTVPPVQLTTPETPNASSSENSFQFEVDQDTQPLLLRSPVSDEDVTGDSDDKRGDSPSGSGSSSPIQDIVNEEEPVVITTRQLNDGEHDKTVFKEHQGDAAIQNTQPKTLVVDSKPSNTGVESDEKKQAPVQPTEHVPEESAGLKVQPSNTQEQQEVPETPVLGQMDDTESLSTQDDLVFQSDSTTVLSIDGDEKERVPVQPVESESKGDQQDSPPLSPQNSVSGDECSSGPSSFTKLPKSDEGDTDNNNDKYIKVSSEDITKEDLTPKGSGSLQGIQPEISVPSPSTFPNVNGAPTIEGHMVIMEDIEDSSGRLVGEGDVSSITGDLHGISIEDDMSSLGTANDEYGEDSSGEDVTGEPEKTNKGDSTLKSSNSTKSSKLHVIAASALAIAGIISGVAVAVYLEMLAVGVAVGACCLVAAVIIYCCNRPSSSFKGSNVELIADKELAATVS